MRIHRRTSSILLVFFLLAMAVATGLAQEPTPGKFTSSQSSSAGFGPAQANQGRSPINPLDPPKTPVLSTPPATPCISASQLPHAPITNDPPKTEILRTLPQTTIYSGSRR